MHSLATDYPAVLLAPREPPCLSLYQATYEPRTVDSLLGPFRALAENASFWSHSLDGLAVLAASDLFRVYRLHRPVAERVVVSDTFHTKPLIRIVQSADRYQVLSVTRRDARLFEGDRDALAEVELAEGVPRTLTDALGDELTEPHLTVASYGAGARGPAMHHGHGSRKDETDIDTRFFRAVDRAVLEHHSVRSMPLILAALPENDAVFRNVSHSPHLADVGVGVSADAVSVDELRERCWRVLEPEYLGRLAGWVEAYGQSRSRELATDDVADAASAAAAGRVGRLLIEAERVVPGKLDRATGRIEHVDLDDADVDDLLDEVAELVLGKGGSVVVVPSERMPTETGLAAIYRF
jgi:hypothetical protein